jgi:hypothetical protein
VSEPLHEPPSVFATLPERTVPVEGVEERSAPDTDRDQLSPELESSRPAVLTHLMSSVRIATIEKRIH